MSQLLHGGDVKARRSNQNKSKRNGGPVQETEKPTKKKHFTLNNKLKCVTHLNIKCGEHTWLEKLYEETFWALLHREGGDLVSSHMAQYPCRCWRLPWALFHCEEGDPVSVCLPVLL